MGKFTVEVSGGEKLHAMLEKLKSNKGASAAVGYFPEDKYPDGRQVAHVAIVGEYGSPRRKLPARPTLRPMGLNMSKKLAGIAKQAFKSNPDNFMKIAAKATAKEGESVLKRNLRRARLEDTGKLLSSAKGKVDFRG